ncbi:MAG: hypothetical protein M3O30_00575 [Planctomycetota bacterium]|nr:hypothetical protein [Planctomycetota bacterium]
MGGFLMADLNTKGELQFQQPYSYPLLEQVPGSSDLIGRCSAAVWSDPHHFEIPLSSTSTGLTLRWVACAETAGIASVRHGDQLLSLTLLVCGCDPASDIATLRAFQSHLLRQLHDTGIEPAFSLLELAERPLAATINFGSPECRADQEIVALIDRCFAAAYFRFQNLA